MNWFIIYLFLKLDNLIGLFTVMMVFSGIVIVAYGVVYPLWLADAYGSEKEQARKNRTAFYSKYFYKKTVILIFFISLFFTVFIPTTKEFAVLYLLPKIVNNTEVQKIPNKALALLNKKLDGWALDLEGKGGKP